MGSHKVSKLYLLVMFCFLQSCQNMKITSERDNVVVSKNLSSADILAISVNSDKDLCGKSPKIYCTISDAIRASNTFKRPVKISLKPFSVHSLASVDHMAESGNGLPPIESNIVIEGNGAIIQRIDDPSTPTFRIFRIDKKGNLKLNNVVIRNGRTATGFDGAGIWNVGKLEITNSLIENNVSGDDGGGIRNDGVLNISATTIRRNQAKWKSGVGAGIQNIAQFGQANMTLMHTAVIDNSANGAGGGVWSNGSSNIEDTTISGNFSGLRGGGIQNYGQLSLSNATVTNNSADVHSGGIHTFVPVEIVNTILSGNHSQFSSDCTGIIKSFGNNIIGNTYNCEIVNLNPNDIIGIQPKVLPLQEKPNFIAHHPVKEISPAFMSGNLTVCASVSKHYQVDDLRVNCHIGTMNLPISFIGGQK